MWTRLCGPTFKHILAPIWLLNYHYGAKNFQVVINGYTGTIAGHIPRAFLEIFFAVDWWVDRRGNHLCIHRSSQHH